MLTGGCYCGAVRYVVEAEIGHRTLCHCRDCRRSSGAPALAWFSVPMGGVHFSHGEPATYRSSAQVLRGFCASCGTTLTYQHARYLDEIDITSASLDDPEAAAPQDHTFVQERLRWMDNPDGLPRYLRTHDEGAAAAMQPSP